MSLANEEPDASETSPASFLLASEQPDLCVTALCDYLIVDISIDIRGALKPRVGYLFVSI